MITIRCVKCNKEIKVSASEAKPMTLCTDCQLNSIKAGIPDIMKDIFKL